MHVTTKWKITQNEHVKIHIRTYKYTYTNMTKCVNMKSLCKFFSSSFLLGKTAAALDKRKCSFAINIMKNVITIAKAP